MAIFRLDSGSAKVSNPLKIVKNVGASILPQGKKQLKILKSVNTSNLKKALTNVVVNGTDPASLVDPATYISSSSKISTLLGVSDERESPKYLTPYGMSATDYLVMRIKTVDVSNDGTHTNSTQEFLDLSALVTISQKKNILMTKVEGRDMSRKEFISSGDIMVTVTGAVYGSLPEQYPEEEIQSLRAMLSTKEVVNVDNPLLNRFGIDGLLILSFKLNQSKGSRNKQSYTFEAVYEKPLETIEAVKATELTALQKRLKQVNEWVSTSTLITKIL